MTSVALDTALVRTATATAAGCLHCGLPVPSDRGDGYCCRGCRAVRAFLERQGLTEYYALGGGVGAPVADLQHERRDRQWLDPILERLAASEGLTRVVLDVQGIHCAACVWLLERLFARAGAGGRLIVNPALGRAELLVPQAFPLAAWVEDAEAAGYALGPPLKTDARAADGLLVRVGVAVALAINSMVFGAALYFGLKDGALAEVVEALTWVLATASVLVGGPVFFRSAWASVRRRTLHFDVPISLGIVLAYTGSVFAFLSGRDAVYFDSVSVFVALMLLGRWLRERALERNRRTVLESGGAEHVLARVMRDQGPVLEPARRVARGDRVVVARGELLVVAGDLDEDARDFSLDWVNGESAARTFRRGERVPAGAFNAGAAAATVVAAESFADSALPGLLARAPSRDPHAAQAWWERTARRYVVTVLVVAAAVAAAWLAVTGDVGRALEVTVSVLVITCPCSFGLAAPMAYEFVLAGLRRTGVFVRDASLLDRLQSVTRVVFDKTGTLTTGVPELASKAPLAGLTKDEAAVLFALASRSAHPKSIAIARALTEEGLTSPLKVEVEETHGVGLAAWYEGSRYQLVAARREAGSSGAAAAADGTVAFLRDGAPRATFEVAETLRPDAAVDVRWLERAGYERWLLSGDATPRVRALGVALGVPADHALGDQRPEDKAAWIRAHDRQDTLMVGDGINDSLAVAEAWCSGTPAVDRPFMPQRTDFHWTHPGLRPVTLALRASGALAHTLRRLLAFAWTYNGAAITLAAVGLMKPWVAAILMPASSVLVLLGTRAALGPGARLWKS